MGGLILDGIYSHIHIQGIGCDLLDYYRTDLEVCLYLRLIMCADVRIKGAVYCDVPCATQCHLTLVDTPTGFPKYAYPFTSNTVREFEGYQSSGDWTFDAWCTHSGRRTTAIPNVHKGRRKKVIGLGWTVDCRKR